MGFPVFVVYSAGNTTEYFYCHEQLTGVRFPDGSTRAAGFDNLNRQIWAVDERGVAVTNAYDKLDRLIASAYVPYEGASTVDDLPDVTSVPASLSPSTCNWAAIYGGFSNLQLRCAYDVIGNLTNLSDWACTTTNGYDALNRRVAEQCRVEALPTLAYSWRASYDLADNRLQATFDGPYDHLVANYTHDLLNRLSNVTVSVMGITVGGNYSYNNNGKLAQLQSLYQGSELATLAYYYDSQNRISQIAGNYSHATMAGLSYTYNDAQQISGMDETIVSSLRRCTYTYDGRDQLTAETKREYDPDGPPYSYSYDQAQNRMNRSKTGVGSESYAYTIANKLTNIYLGSTSANNRYFYDRAGNLEYRVVNNVTNWYDYNAQNKLARIRGVGFTNEFIYDSQNRRVSLCQNGTWRYEAHDGALPVGSFGQDRQVQNWCVRGVGIAEGTGDVIAEVDMSGASARPYYYLCNHRGDTLVVLNSSGTVTARMRYDAFGNMYDVSTNSVYFPRYTFSTKEYLSQPKLYLYAYRVYDPVAGRWTQRDPIDYQDSLNLYQFCGNNPLNNIDVDGKLWSEVRDFAVAALGAFASDMGWCLPSISQDLSDESTSLSPEGAMLGHAAAVAAGAIETVQGAATIVAGLAVDAAAVGVTASGAGAPLGGAGAVAGTGTVVIGAAVAAHGLITASTAVDRLSDTMNYREHSTNKRASNWNKHSKGDGTRAKNKGGEKADPQRKGMPGGKTRR